MPNLLFRTKIHYSKNSNNLFHLNDEADLNPYECEVKGGLDSSNTQIVSDVNMINNLNRETNDGQTFTEFRSAVETEKEKQEEFEKLKQ